MAFRSMMATALDSQPAEAIGGMLAGGNGEDDRAVATQSHLQSLMGTNVKEGYRQSPDGPSADDIVINSPWGFRLQDIETRIDVWQGEIDLNVPLIQGEYQHSLLSNSTLHVLKNTAQLFPLVRWKEILQTLIRK